MRIYKLSYFVLLFDSEFYLFAFPWSRDRSCIKQHEHRDRTSQLRPASVSRSLGTLRHKHAGQAKDHTDRTTAHTDPAGKVRYEGTPSAVQYSKVP